MSCQCYYCVSTRNKRPVATPSHTEKLTPKEKILRQQKARLMEAEENSKYDPVSDARHAAHRERILAKRKAMLAPTLAAVSSAAVASEDEDDDLDDEMELKWLTVSEGQLTFDSEGNDNDGSIHFTRLMHLPLAGVVSTSEVVAETSGITIGRGLDVGSRTSEEVQGLFDKVAENCRPISPELLAFLKASVGMKGASNKIGKGLTGASKEAHIAKSKAQDKAFVKYYRDFKNLANKDKITLTRKQQHFLFLEIYPFYVSETKRLMTKMDVQEAYKEYGILDYDALPQKIKDVLIDLTYRGDNHGTFRKHVMPKLINKSTDDYNEFKEFMKHDEYWAGTNIDSNRLTLRGKHL